MRDAIADVAGQLNTEVTERTAELERIFLDKIPELHGDDAIRELLVASTASNLSVMFEALRHGIAVDQIEVPTPAAAYAQRLAQRDLPVEALLRAYRLGDHRFIQWFMERLATWVSSPEQLERATSEVVSFVVDYVDRVSEALIEIYAEERELWAQRTDAARAARIRAVLSDTSLDEATAEIMVGRAMHRWHVGVVLWLEREQHDAAAHMDEATRALHDVGPSETLVVPADAHTLWAWLTAPTEDAAREVDLSPVIERCPAVRVAIGEPARHLHGFRTTHREALQARAVAETASPTQRDTHFTQVRLAALLSENLDDLRAWVQRTLGDLATDDEPTARLRETVRTYLETGGVSVETARRLYIHRNTVRYRVQRAEEIRGRPLEEDRIALEVALVACSQLGSSVLRPPANG
ncbi:MAG: helix-turn-helix domain-containing protein [Nitriliruptoraceae bacterium]